MLKYETIYKNEKPNVNGKIKVKVIEKKKHHVIKIIIDSNKYRKLNEFSNDLSDQIMDYLESNSQNL